MKLFSKDDQRRITLGEITRNQKKNKNSQILEIFILRPLSVKFIPETAKERGNPPTYYPKLLTQFINMKLFSKDDQRRITLGEIT
jgi:hypothetical protein